MELNLKIAEFLRDTVIGRQLETEPVIYLLDNGLLEGEYSDRMVFSDLVITEAGLSFNMTTVTEEKIYILDHEGSRSGIKKDFTGTSVFNYSMALRKSTGALTGYMRLISSSVPEHTMEAIVYGVHHVLLSGRELSWKEQQMLYRDTPSGEGFTPVAFDSSVRFFLEEGKLRFEYLPYYYDYFPEKNTRRLSKDNYPPFISKQVL